MMKYILGIVALLFIGGGVWWYVQPNDTAPVTTAPAPGEKPWVEVVTASATAIDMQGTITSLESGDEITVGSVIKTNATGVVLIHFPDGSFAKLDPNSSITITETSYDKSSGALNVHITLGAGTLWSKVLDLVGVSSSWKVETSNAVATVRGTSFMTSVSKGKTRVVGIEHSVAVTPLQPDTRQPLGREVEVTTEAQVTIDDTRIPALASGKEQLTTAPVSADIPTSGAYKTFKEREKQFDTLRDSLKEKSENDIEFRREFREAQVKEFEDKILEKRKESVRPQPFEQTNTTVPKDTRADIKTDTTVVPAQTQTEKRVETVAPKTTDTDRTAESITQNGGTTPEIRPVSLSITSDRDVSGGMTEGDTVTFRAILLLSDNSKKDVTRSVEWNVINNIGVFPIPGNFRAQLSPNDAELGEVPGAVYATLKDSDGKELNAASKPFVIHAYVPPQTSTEG